MIFQSTVQNTAPKSISESVAKELRKIENVLGGATVYIRPLNEQEEAKEELEKIFSGDERDETVYLPYSKNILIMYDYATTHFHRISGDSMLTDIEKGKKITIGNYISKN